MQALVLLAALLTWAAGQGGVLFVTMHTTHYLHSYSVASGSLLAKQYVGSELRGLAVLGSTLLVAQAGLDTGALWNVSRCSQVPPAMAVADASLSHPYGLAQVGSTLFVSNQDSTAVASFALPALTPVANPLPAIGGMRGIAADDAGRLYITSKTDNAVYVFDAHFKPAASVSVEDPIGVLVVDNVLFVSQGVSPGNVFAFDISAALKPLWTSERSFQHGSGIAFNDGLLYVGEQDTLSVQILNATDGAYIGAFLTDLKNVPEQLRYTPDCA